MFHLHGLKTIVLVCDGASSNLTMLKATDQFEVYSLTNGISLYIFYTILDTLYMYIEDGDYPFAINPVMLNPFDPPNLIHWLICPTHQVK